MDQQNTLSSVDAVYPTQRMSLARRALLLINRQARRGRVNIVPTVHCLQELGFVLIIEFVENCDNFPHIIQRYAQDVDLVIVGGGDGTLNAAIEGLVDTQLPLGILPLGTANDLARTLGIPESLSRACQIIGAGHLRRIDLGWVNGKHFLNVASLGLSVQLTRRVTQASKRRWGMVSYAVAALRLILQAQPFAAEVQANGKSLRVKAIQITVGNGRYYGGGLAVATDASIEDQRLDVYILQIQHWWKILTLPPALKLGQFMNRPSVITLRGREIEIKTRKPCFIDTDGEITTQTPARFCLVPQAVSVFVPQQN